LSSLTCNAHRDHTTATCRDTAIANLKYGSIGVNLWSGLAYGIGGCSWGAFPGETLDNVESGIGVVNNLLFFPGVVKTVSSGACATHVHLAACVRPSGTHVVSSRAAPSVRPGRRSPL